ncbi:phytoene synthase [Arthrobacter sp. ERGS1:01]|uniref:phytoene/squalene synthase family protein n=1 Tax=Arthrobacter sp. ERGS1:01 TaxID=1704044 RepID=UPI0006B62881|nr:squalene/phytoene synthase family protein [Arthrobacter sp. ERGS1:01]ALE06491.1 phytoene synthase [Arthrobacter sp. ERGS1:01]
MGIDPLSHYSETASRSAGVVIGSYSTSFGLACLLLGSRERRDIENIYALVRVADEVVDGAAEAAGLDPAAVCAQLDRLELETEQALATGYSTNMVVHAFALTARRTSIDTSLTKPFFASMRTDVSVSRHTPDSLEEYIYGSAEVVGLMCLKVFQAMDGAPGGHDGELANAARSLGAAFQKVNFLRDLGADSSGLGRSYFPELDPAAFDDGHKMALLAEIRHDLAVAKAGMVFLSPPARRAVRLAHDIFLALVVKLERVPAAELAGRRVRVPGYRKACIALAVCAGNWRTGSGAAGTAAVTR